MDDLRFQVFVSSTYTDLKDERQKVTQTLMEMDCIPAGMELFPAADEEQWAFIKKVINDCDYYLLIIAGRYGSLTEEGISFTEKEYDYAVEIGLKVVALIHGSPEQLPTVKSDGDPKLKQKLDAFREKVSKGRLVKFWEKPEDLPGMVALSLQKTIRAHPAKGWVRAGGPSAQKLLQEINELRKENLKLQTKLSDFEKPTAYKVDNIAGLDETYTIHGDCYSSNTVHRYSWKVSISWRELFSLVSPCLARFPSQEAAKSALVESLFKKSKVSGSAPKIDEQNFETITIQLKALGLITVKYSKTVGGGMAWFWYLTGAGERLMVEERIVRTAVAVKA